VPAAYRGHWNTDLADCTRESGDGRLVIDAGSITFFESGGPVTAVSQQAGVLTVTMTLTGEGETWTETRSLRLSADGDRLTDLETDTTRSRCP
jgi:hypothetical protein